MAWSTAAVLIAIVLTAGGVGAFAIHALVRPRGDREAKAAKRWDDAVAALDSLERRLERLERGGA